MSHYMEAMGGKKDFFNIKLCVLFDSYFDMEAIEKKVKLTAMTHNCLVAAPSGNFLGFFLDGNMLSKHSKKWHRGRPVHR